MNSSSLSSTVILSIVLFLTSCEKSKRQVQVNPKKVATTSGSPSGPDSGDSKFPDSSGSGGPSGDGSGGPSGDGSGDPSGDGSGDPSGGGSGGPSGDGSGDPSGGGSGGPTGGGDGPPSPSPDSGPTPGPTPDSGPTPGPTPDSNPAPNPGPVPAPSPSRDGVSTNLNLSIDGMGVVVLTGKEEDLTKLSKVNVKVKAAKLTLAAKGDQTSGAKIQFEMNAEFGGKACTFSTDLIFDAAVKTPLVLVCQK